MLLRTLHLGFRLYIFPQTLLADVIAFLMCQMTALRVLSHRQCHDVHDSHPRNSLLQEPDLLDVALLADGRNFGKHKQIP